MKTIFEKSKPDLKATGFPTPRYQSCYQPPAELLRQDLMLPEVSEPELIRHYTQLSRCNMGIDNAFYPLGSCTMKYNPKINEALARLEAFSEAHPLLPPEQVQGCLKLMYRLQVALSLITGLEAVCLAPAAGAHGELAGLMIAKAYFKGKGERRTKVIVPDSSHGTNPASAASCGFDVVKVASDETGRVALNELQEKLDKEVAVFMLTNPNTLGIFEKDVRLIAKLVHQNGSLMYADGANANALLGKTNFNLMGFDLLHLNLHKTFATPHGGGGPGAGPLCASKELKDFLPTPVVVKKGKRYLLAKPPKTIGYIRSFYGNFSVLLKAYAYIFALGHDGLNEVSSIAVLNANYLKQKLRSHFRIPYDTPTKHEFVIDDSEFGHGVTCVDVAKRLIDYGFHPPTISFPLIVPGALMLEPTETETKETLDAFAEALIKIKEEAASNPELVKTAPHTTPLARLDEVMAARRPDLCYPWKPA